MDAERDYTPAEVAALLRTSEWWVREQTRRMRVPHQRYGRGRIAFTAAQVEALRALAAVPAADPAGQQLPALALVELGATARSRAAHRRARVRAANTT